MIHQVHSYTKRFPCWGSRLTMIVLSVSHSGPPSLCVSLHIGLLLFLLTVWYRFFSTSVVGPPRPFIEVTENRKKNG